ncbi:VOC family protein [Antrihabitans spumae]|uniref:VOC family protein n=1 Tax=Antrihabitans spumae TaxID=3373370 RepID=A0ABW7JZR6_9NOCA
MSGSPLNRVESIVFPTRDLDASIKFWSVALGHGPAFRTDDFASFEAGNVSVGLTKAPWRDEPVVFWACDQIEDAHRALTVAGAVTMIEVAGGTLEEQGEGTPVAGVDSATGAVDVPGARLATMRAPDGTLVALNQALEESW